MELPATEGPYNIACKIYAEGCDVVYKLDLHQKCDDHHHHNDWPNIFSRSNDSENQSVSRPTRMNNKEKHSTLRSPNDRYSSFGS
jgi:hypothetical protein